MFFVDDKLTVVIAILMLCLGCSNNTQEEVASKEAGDNANEHIFYASNAIDLVGPAAKIAEKKGLKPTLNQCEHINIKEEDGVTIVLFETPFIVYDEEKGETYYRLDGGTRVYFVKENDKYKFEKILKIQR